METIIAWAKKEIILLIFVLLFVSLAVLNPHLIIHYPCFIDWKTIIALTGLLIITTGLKESGYLYFFSKRILNKTGNERNLAIFLILLSAFLSTFLTNDITLFIVIPLTLSLQNLVKRDISKLVIFETISVNVGSTLTPIGNPQNLFLWHKWGISFVMFIIKMLPLVVVLVVALLIFIWIVFPNKKVEFSDLTKIDRIPQKSLFYFSLAILLAYLIFLETEQAQLALPVIFIFYLIFYKDVLLKTDWLLLLIFIIIFIDFHIIATIPFMVKYVHTLNLHSSKNVFLLSVVTSQLISNVPASVFVSKFSHNWLAISYGVNVGGNGLAIGSLANIIALRMANGKKMWLKFHKYSIVFFLITLGITYFFF